jgi:hypothetical protein
MSDIHGAALDIRHATTSDCPDGAPWPPAGNGWVMVRRGNGLTLWRSIQLLPSDPPPADAHSILGGCTERKQLWQPKMIGSPRNASTRKS